MRLHRRSITAEILEENGLHEVHPEILHFAQINGYSVDSVERLVDEILGYHDRRKRFIETEVLVEVLRGIQACQSAKAELQAEAEARRAAEKKGKACESRKKWSYPKKPRRR